MEIAEVTRGIKKIGISPIGKLEQMYYTEKGKHILSDKRAILEDAKDTEKRLSVAASSLKICDNPILRKYEYGKIKFRNKTL